VGAWLHEALDLGVKMYVCTDSMELNDVTRDDLLEGVELAGIATMLSMADEAHVVLTI
jgi:predicted peroxiredoxin